MGYGLFATGVKFRNPRYVEMEADESLLTNDNLCAHLGFSVPKIFVFGNVFLPDL